MEDAARLAESVLASGCVFIGRRRRVRRLRRRVQPRAPDRWGGALLRAARRVHLSAQTGIGIVARVGGARARAARQQRRTRGGIPRARGIRGGQSRLAGQLRRPQLGVARGGLLATTTPPRAAEIERTTGRPACACGWRWTGPATPARRRASASSTTCSTCSRATAGWTSTSRPPVTSRPARTTRPRTSASCWGGRSTRRSATAVGVTRYGDATIPMDEALAACAIDISGRPYSRLDGRDPGRHDRRVRHRAGGGVLPRRGEQREADRCTCACSPAPTPTTWWRPASSRSRVRCGRRWRSTRRRPAYPRRRASCDRGWGPRIAILDYGMGNLRSVEKALERAGATPVRTRDHDEIRAADGVVLPGVGAFPKAMAQPARAAVSTC